jgi:glycosyltransferase involved in cell wall biosynthesis
LYSVLCLDGFMKIFLIDDRVPHPRLGYGYCRAHCIIDSLLRHGQQVVMVPIEENCQDGFGSCFKDSIRIIQSLSVAIDEMSRTDAVWISRLSNLQTVNRLSPSLLRDRRWLYDCEALNSTRNQLWSSLGYQPLPGQVFDVSVEAALMKDAHVTIAASPMDAAALAANGVDINRILGHSIRCQPSTAPFKQRRGVLFLGSFHNPGRFSPNCDAAQFIVERIWPSLKPHVSHLTIAGYGASKALAELGIEAHNLRIEDDVNDLGPLYGKHRVVLAPTRFASGIPWKIHEALSFGVPTVLSPVLADQLISESPGYSDFFSRWSTTSSEELSKLVQRLYTDEKEWTVARNTGLKVVRDACSHHAFDDGISECIRLLQS